MSGMRLLHGCVLTFSANERMVNGAAQRFCQSQAGAEMMEILCGLKHRFNVLGVSFPEEVIVDNCCHIVAFIKTVFPDIKISLDVYHFLHR